jgi:hypothetical protein
MRRRRDEGWFVVVLVAGIGAAIAPVTGANGGEVEQGAIQPIGPATDGRWSFRNHVIPVLTRSGCNMGSCHGAAAGKNGLRLSLRGYAPEVDHAVLTRQAGARRVNTSAPAESLMLLKATGALEHGGGRRFAPDSLEYRIVSEWIADGAPGPSDADPLVAGIEAQPRSAALQNGQTQALKVVATYSDGRRVDVTRWARFDSTDISVAKVDDHGKVTVVGPGEGAISVFFSSRVDIARVSVPYPASVDPAVFARAERRNLIDEKNLAKLQALNLPPSPPADDAAFLRRAYLDATGTLPPAHEVDPFLADPDPDKRWRLVDRLIASEEYVDFWSYKWSDLLLVSTRKLPAPAVWSFYRAVRQAVKSNEPWDQVARRVVTAKGSTLSNGWANYFVLHRDTIDLTESTSVAFLGLSLTCARCHDHPLEKWTQDQYYGMANLFARVRLKDGQEAAGEVIVTAAAEGDIRHPRRGSIMAPQPLDGHALALDSRGDRREALADWLADPSNPYFDRAIVNRVWAQFFGRGLVNPEDDLRATNPASDRELFDALVTDFRGHGRDVKHLVRLIMTSGAYQRSSVPLAENAADSRFLSHHLPRRLAAEVLLDAIDRVTEVATAFPGYPPGWRALQLPDSKVESLFLDAFGRPARESVCSCERTDLPSVSQALHLANGPTLNEKLRSDQSVAARLAVAGASDDAIADSLFRAALARPPRPEERMAVATSLAEARGIDDPDRARLARREAIEDLAWGLLTSKEFLFNH